MKNEDGQKVVGPVLHVGLKVYFLPGIKSEWPEGSYLFFSFYLSSSVICTFMLLSFHLPYSFADFFLLIFFSLFPAIPPKPDSHSHSHSPVFWSLLLLLPLPPHSQRVYLLMTHRTFCLTDYAKGFGGQYGIQKDRVDKVKYQQTIVLSRVPEV